MLHSGCRVLAKWIKRHALVKKCDMSLVSFLLTISFSGVTIWMCLQAVVSTSACNSRIHWWLVGLWRNAKKKNATTNQNEYSGWWYACMAFLLLAAAFFFSSCSRACPLCTCIPLVVCEECHMYTLAVHNLTSHVSCMCSFFCGPPFHSPQWRQVEQLIRVTSLCCSHKLLLCQTWPLSPRNYLWKYTYAIYRLFVICVDIYVCTYLLAGYYKLLWASRHRRFKVIQRKHLFVHRNFMHSFESTVLPLRLDDT